MVPQLVTVNKPLNNQTMGTQTDSHDLSSSAQRHFKQTIWAACDSHCLYTVFCELNILNRIIIWIINSFSGGLIKCQQLWHLHHQTLQLQTPLPTSFSSPQSARLAVAGESKQYQMWTFFFSAVGYKDLAVRRGWLCCTSQTWKSLYRDRGGRVEE